MYGTLRFLYLSHLLYGICVNKHYESVYFKELHNLQEYYWPTIYRAGQLWCQLLLVKKIAAIKYRVHTKNTTIFQVLFQKRVLFWSDFQLLKNNNGFKCFLASGNLVKPSHPFRNNSWKMVAVFLYEAYFWLLLFPFLLTGKLTLLIA